MGAEPPANQPEPFPRRPRRGLARALAAFMEERNIFWGELLGGALLVGCSIALIITLWDALTHNPLFKFGTFVGADAAVLGAGLYTLRRWKLEVASRGLLLLSLLLAPVALLGMTVATGAPSRLDLPVQIASVAALGLLAHRAGRVLVPEGAWLAAVAV